MSKLTPFGIAVRKIRLDRGLRLIEMADKLEMSTAYLSAIETGRKPVPDGLVGKISRSLEWSADELALIRKSIDQTRKEVRIDDRSGEERELITAFARRLDEVPSDMIEQLKKMLLKSFGDDVPFERRRRGIVVPPLSTVRIRQFADQVRDAFVPPERVDFPIIDVLEFFLPKLDPTFVLDIQDSEEMGANEGLVPVGGTMLILRRDVFDGACRGGGRHRFTASHELSHYLMHRHIALARAHSVEDKIYTDSEWQADTFAGALLMPKRHVARFRCAEEMAEACKVSRQAALYMWTTYSREGEVAI